jgi:hypothetical protein
MEKKDIYDMLQVAFGGFIVVESSKGEKVHQYEE